MSSASDPQDSRSSVRQEFGGKEPPPDQSKLLEQVLASTSFRTTNIHLLPAGELEALRQVARRHSGRSLSLQPVLEDLVEALLAQQLCALVPRPAARRAMATEIARTLYDDAVSRERLQSLWIALLENKP